MSGLAKPGDGRRRRGAQAVVLLLLALLLAGCGGLQPGAAAADADPAGREVKPAPGYRAADIRGTDVFTGEVVSLSDLKGTPVLLNFWATWCGPCRDEMPEMEEFHQEMGDAVRVVAVSADAADSPEKMAAFAEALGLTFAVVHDGGKAARAYRVGAIPTSFFIDGEGVIQVRYTGPLTLEQMKEYAELASNTAEDPEHP